MSAAAIWIGIAIGIFGFIGLAAIAIIIAAFVIHARSEKADINKITEVEMIDDVGVETLTKFLDSVYGRSNDPDKGDSGSDRNNIRGS